MGMKSALLALAAPCVGAVMNAGGVPYAIGNPAPTGKVRVSHYFVPSVFWLLWRSYSWPCSLLEGSHSSGAAFSAAVLDGVREGVAAVL